MKQIEADPLPVISQKWGQENEDEKCHYISPFPKQCNKWIKYQTELFKKHNPINACDIEGKITPYNSRIYFKKAELNRLWRNSSSYLLHGENGNGEGPGECI